VIQRVASAIVTGDAIHVAVRTDDANSQAGANVRRHHIRDPQSAPRHFGKPATCQVGRVRARKWRRAVVGGTVRVVPTIGTLKAARDARESRSAAVASRVVVD